MTDTPRNDARGAIAIVAAIAAVIGFGLAVLGMLDARRQRMEVARLERDLAQLRLDANDASNRAELALKLCQIETEEQRLELRMCRGEPGFVPRVRPDGGAPRADAGAQCNCVPGDPLCSCL